MKEIIKSKALKFILRTGTVSIIAFTLILFHSFFSTLNNKKDD